MFTGIVQAVGKVVRLEPQRLWITRENLEVSLGASVAVNGVCLTVAALDGEKMAFDLSWETLARTNLGELGPGDPVNLEPALRPDAELGGHSSLVMWTQWEKSQSSRAAARIFFWRYPLIPGSRSFWPTKALSPWTG